MPETLAGFTDARKRVRAFVVFQPSSQPIFWDAFTSPAWRHCWLILPCSYPSPGLMADVYSIKVEPVRWGIDFAVWWAEPEIVAREFYKAGVTAIVQVDVDLPPKHSGFIPRGLPTCVTMVKAALGLRAWNVWTPKALFRYLLEHANGELLP